MKETKAATAETKSKKKDPARQATQQNAERIGPACLAGHTALHRCYGQIGIPAVAAAVRYQGAAKNPAYAPTSIKSYDGSSEAIA